MTVRLEQVQRAAVEGRGGAAEGAVIVRSAQRFPSGSQSMAATRSYGYAADDCRLQRAVSRA